MCRINFLTTTFWPGSNDFPRYAIVGIINVCKLENYGCKGCCFLKMESEGAQKNH